jgi:hypothetical protein
VARTLPQVQRRTTENTIVKKLLSAVAMTFVFAGSAMAQSDTGLAPRDPPFGKGNPANDTMHEPDSGGSLFGSGGSLFGVGGLFGPAANQSIPPRDPPYGKGNAGNDTMREPNAADLRRVADDTTTSETPKSTKTKSDGKKKAAKSAKKKDPAAGGAKQDGAPKTDTE